MPSSPPADTATIAIASGPASLQPIASPPLEAEQVLQGACASTGPAVDVAVEEHVHENRFVIVDSVPPTLARPNVSLAPGKEEAVQPSATSAPATASLAKPERAASGSPLIYVEDSLHYVSPSEPLHIDFALADCLEPNFPPLFPPQLHPQHAEYSYPHPYSSTSALADPFDFVSDTSGHASRQHSLSFSSASSWMDDGDVTMMAFPPEFPALVATPPPVYGLTFHHSLDPPLPLF